VVSKQLFSAQYTRECAHTNGHKVCIEKWIDGQPENMMPRSGPIILGLQDGKAKKSFQSWIIPENPKPYCVKTRSSATADGPRDAL